MKMRLAFSILSLGLAFACQPRLADADTTNKLDLPHGFPAPEIPEANKLSAKRVALGKQLFYDPILSLDSSISCGSCHLVEKAFTDGNAVSIGIQGRIGFRNVPTLTNVAYHPYFFAEGGNPTLEMQILGPIEEHHEMGFNAAELHNRLASHPEYQALAQAAYGRDMDLFVLTRAIASFERTMISGDSPYDRFVQGDGSALTKTAQRGLQLFESDRLACRSCHDGFNFTDYSFQNIGLYTEYTDRGRARISLDEADVGKFKTPTLRNVALTAPYMHDGSLPTLASVIEHFDSGGKGHINQSPLVRPLGLCAQEKADLLAFLESLTDSAFVANPDFGQP